MLNHSHILTNILKVFSHLQQDDWLPFVLAKPCRSVCVCVCVFVSLELVVDVCEAGEYQAKSLKAEISNTG